MASPKNSRKLRRSAGIKKTVIQVSQVCLPAFGLNRLAAVADSAENDMVIKLSVEGTDKLSSLKN